MVYEILDCVLIIIGKTHKVNNMNFTRTIDTLLDWKKLPAYKAEPRVDFIVAGALPEILKQKLNEDIQLIIPELPIRIGSIYSSMEGINKSYKVDFYVLLKGGRNIFLEFKTDSGSRRDKQDQYLIASTNVGMKTIIDGIIKISKASTYKTKYKYLLDKLIKNNLIRNDNGIFSASVSNDKIEVLYVQPSSTKENEIGFEEISELMIKSDDEFYQHFGTILKKWTDN